jgi:ATP-dependent RNA helicase DeaD
MKSSIEIAIGKKNSGTENVEHIYYMVQAKDRYSALKRIVDINPNIYAIIFCRTRQETKEVAEKLMQDGYNADALHGDLSQVQRDTVMQRFRIKNLQILVATDVAARGLDVNNLTHVINYNLPDDIENYTHRSGRTGRAGKKGVSISIIHSREKSKIKNIEKVLHRTFIQEKVPSGLEVCQSQLFSLIAKIENAGENINQDLIAPYLPVIMDRLKDLSREELIVNFVSQEFNRFLDYYKEAPDLNIPEKKEKRDGNRDRKKGGNFTRLKINVGERDGFTPKRVLGLINDTTNDKNIGIHDIEITQRYTFFDVKTDLVRSMMNAFEKRKNDGVQLLEVFKDRRSHRSNDDSWNSRKKKGHDYEFKNDRKKRSDRKGESQKEFKRNKDSFRRKR